MLSRLILEDAPVSDHVAIVTREGSTTWSELRDQAQFAVTAQSSLTRRRVGLSLRPTTESYAALAAFDCLKCDVFLFDAHLPAQDVLRVAQRLKLGAVLTVSEDESALELDVHELPGEEKWSGNSSVTILTSGSTGEPKAARHSWESLSRPVRKGPENLKPRWLLTYRPDLYAGLQVMLQCFVDRGTLALPSSDMDPQAVAQFMCSSEVEFVSATPSYWRRLLMFANPNVLKKVPIKQITLGGEITDQPLLDQLKHHFPDARLVHIYATTELGRCFSVNDGRAGFPAHYLTAPLSDGVEMKVCDGELLIRSPNSMRMYDPHSSHQGASTDWFPTGDLAEIREDRVYFVGRKTEMINVAGSKVYPIEVERVIRSIPGISDVRVFGKSSSIAGELVACEIVGDSSENPEVLREAINTTCRAKLASHQQPRFIKFVDKINLSAAGKTLRNISQ